MHTLNQTGISSGQRGRKVSGGTWSPPAGNWPQTVSEVLLPTWPGSAAGGDLSAPAPSATETHVSDEWQSQGHPTVHLL